MDSFVLLRLLNIASFFVYLIFAAAFVLLKQVPEPKRYLYNSITAFASAAFSTGILAVEYLFRRNLSGSTLDIVFIVAFLLLGIKEFALYKNAMNGKARDAEQCSDVEITSDTP